MKKLVLVGLTLTKGESHIQVIMGVIGLTDQTRSMIVKRGITVAMVTVPFPQIIKIITTIETLGITQNEVTIIIMHIPLVIQSIMIFAVITVILCLAGLNHMHLLLPMQIVIVGERMIGAVAVVGLRVDGITSVVGIPVKMLKK